MSTCKVQRLQLKIPEPGVFPVAGDGDLGVRGNRKGIWEQLSQVLGPKQPWIRRR